MPDMNVRSPAGTPTPASTTTTTGTKATGNAPAPAPAPPPAAAKSTEPTSTPSSPSTPSAFDTKAARNGNTGIVQPSAAPPAKLGTPEAPVKRQVTFTYDAGPHTE